MKKIVLILFGTLVSACAIGQGTSASGYELPGVVENGDTIAVVHVPRVYIFPTLRFASKDEYNHYKKLVRDVKKVYPYSQLAKSMFTEVQNIMDTLPNNKTRKKYIKEKEKEVVDRYYKELVSMTLRQGEILLKLVDRELNRSSYDIIKELRGGFSAAMWQGIAKAFGESLKTTYEMTGEDLLIERIVIQIEQGTI